MGARATRTRRRRLLRRVRARTWRQIQARAIAGVVANCIWRVFARLTHRSDGSQALKLVRCIVDVGRKFAARTPSAKPELARWRPPTAPARTPRAIVQSLVAIAEASDDSLRLQVRYCRLLFVVVCCVLCVACCVLLLNCSSVAQCLRALCEITLRCPSLVCTHRCTHASLRVDFAYDAVGSEQRHSRHCLRMRRASARSLSGKDSLLCVPVDLAR